jgi:hypothetical protein
MTHNWHVGNAHTDGQEHRGWLIGHFLGDADGVRASRDVEVKWGSTLQVRAARSG